MATPFKYAYPGPPFNWLGTFTATQEQAFESWVNARVQNFPAVEVFHRIRAQQLRKSAGLLEKYYASFYDETLAPTFQKTAWQPGPDGHWIPSPRNDHIPMISVSNIKAAMQPQFERQDEAVFHMNHLRVLIERSEDDAENASLGETVVNTELGQIKSLFGQPQYEAVLVDDQNPGNMYNGTTPFWRTHALDVPTTWELEQRSRIEPGDTVAIKYVDTEAGQ